jgi:hypothetical protein
MAFSNDVIRALVNTGSLGDEGAERYLSDVLIKRRDKIGSTYLTRINPIVEPTLDASAGLTFDNAAVRHAFTKPPQMYTAQWYAFDNATGESTRIAETTSQRERLAAPRDLPTAGGTFVRVDISAEHPDHPSWKQPVRAFFQRHTNGWRLVGFERMPE